MLWYSQDGDFLGANYLKNNTIVPSLKVETRASLKF